MVNNFRFYLLHISYISLNIYTLFTSHGFCSGKIGFVVLENPKNDTAMTIVCLRVPVMEIDNFGSKIVRHLVCRSRDIRRTDLVVVKLAFLLLQNSKMTIILQINMSLYALFKKYILWNRNHHFKPPHWIVSSISTFVFGIIL